MGQLYYAQTQLYSIVLGGEIQRTVRIKHRDPLLTSRSSSFLGSSRKFSTRAKFLYDEYVLLSPPIYLSASDSAGPRRTVGASVLLAR